MDSEAALVEGVDNAVVLVITAIATALLGYVLVLFLGPSKPQLRLVSH